MRSLRELSRRLDALEGAQGERLVAIVRFLSVGNRPELIAGLETADWVKPARRWERLPGEALDDLRSRAASEVGDGRYGFYAVCEFLDPRVRLNRSTWEWEYTSGAGSGGETHV